MVGKIYINGPYSLLSHNFSFYYIFTNMVPVIFISCIVDPCSFILLQIWYKITILPFIISFIEFY